MDTTSYLTIGIAFLVAGIVAFATTPLVKKFAYVVGAVDVPKDNRRMHKTPMPRLGGLAIFFGFLIAILLFGSMDRVMASILIGALIIVTLGIFDDILRLQSWIKFIVQCAAACVPVLYGGLRIEFFTSFNLFSGDRFLYLGYLSIPITIIWIVGMTNAVNFIDGLDGLAAGVSTIASLSLLAVSCITQNSYVAIVMACLTGACVGFLPYNLNPAKIFMGDTGALFLGFILATMSIQGLFKFYAVISFAVPFLILGLPLFDMIVSVLRRVLSGKSPMAADREHIHHKLIDMGFNQKQAVAILYGITIILGLIAVVLALYGASAALLVLLGLLVIGVIVFKVLLRPKAPDASADPAQPAETSPTAEKVQSEATDTPDGPAV
ncbi:MAG: MraY family glycosyltransferase [Eubacteriales bacterium]|jgi:UDP-GlcNAc:undecaprenyl-phosphate GlcNAc-1-phosphate transferase